MSKNAKKSLTLKKIKGNYNYSKIETEDWTLTIKG